MIVQLNRKKSNKTKVQLSIPQNKFDLNNKKLGEVIKIKWNSSNKNKIFNKDYKKEMKHRIAIMNIDYHSTMLDT